jgi:uncharacterized protein YjdB
MTRQLLFSIAASAALAAVACDTNPRNQIALVGPAVIDTVTTGAALIITPSFVQVDAGSLVQLSTQAGTFSPQLVWDSSQPSVATVSQNGLVTTLTPGTTTISAFFSFDPLNRGVATIVVTPFGNP